MAVPITRIKDLDDLIQIYIPTDELPNSSYVNQYWLDGLHMGYEDNIVNFITFIHREHELPLSFDIRQYKDLIEHLKYYFIYDLQQARIIIKWIDKHVPKSTDNFGRGDVYLEILENADGC